MFPQNQDGALQRRDKAASIESLSARVMLVPCTVCQLRQKTIFHQVSSSELDFISSLKTAHVQLAQKVDVIRAGEVGGQLYTLYGGWAFRYTTLPDGKRQILGFLLPGDLIGLESTLLGSTEHSVQTVTPVSLCLLDGRPLRDIFENEPEMAARMMRLLVEEQRRTDAHLMLLGHKDGPQRLGWLMLEIFDRLDQRGMANGTWCPFPVQRQQLADALGLSRTHLIRSLAELQRRGLAHISSHTLAVPDREGLVALSGYRIGEGAGRRFMI